jgi:Uma2 family endonuclease
MTIAKEKETSKQSPELVDWEIPLPPTDLIFDDGEPMESNRHRINMNALIRAIVALMVGRKDYFVGGNMFVYYSSEQARNRDFRGPDFFVVLNIDGSKERQSWIVWEENGRYPNVIVELMSPSTAETDRTTKKDIYEQTFRTPDYFIYDPFDPNSLQGWHLDSAKGYQGLKANEKGWLWSESLDLWLGTWEGMIEEQTGIWLRFYHRDGNLVLLPEEEEKQRAEAEKQRAEAEKQRAEAEKQRAERLAQRLRELGEDVDV